MDGWPELERCLHDGQQTWRGLRFILSYATSVKGQDWPDDENFAVEVYYDFRVQTTSW